MSRVLPSGVNPKGHGDRLGAVYELPDHQRFVAANGFSAAKMPPVISLNFVFALTQSSRAAAGRAASDSVSANQTATRGEPPWKPITISGPIC